MALLQEVPPWWPATLAQGDRGAAERTSSPRAIPRYRCAGRSRSPLARPDQVERRRRQRDPGARRYRSPSIAGSGCRCCPSGAGSTRSSRAAPGSRNLHTGGVGRAGATRRRATAAAWAGERGARSWAGTSTSAPRRSMASARPAATGWTRCSCEARGPGPRIRDGVLDRGPLSDHAPVLVERARQPGDEPRAARRPKPRSTSNAFSPSVPRPGRTPSCVAAL